MKRGVKNVIVVGIVSAEEKLKIGKLFFDILLK